jgi:hypothetical protein
MAGLAPCLARSLAIACPAGAAAIALDTAPAARFRLDSYVVEPNDTPDVP